MRALVATGLLLCSCLVNGAEMRTIEYERSEFRGEPEQRKAVLATFVYDIPYFGACGIFPPRHIINQFFNLGSSGGGMSPGATWAPFSLDDDEYDRLVEVIARLDPKALRERVRYTWVKYEFDKGFDHLPDWESWIAAVCEKHRESYHAKHRAN